MTKTDNFQQKGLAWLLLPATALMNRLQYSHKFILIFFLFSLPLAFTTYLFISEVNLSIQSTSKEIFGTQYLRPLMQLQRGISDIQILSSTYSDGDAEMRSVLNKKLDEVNDSFLKLKSINRLTGSKLGATEKFKQVDQDWQSLREAMRDPLAVSENNGCEKLIKNIRALMAHIGNTSNLILDPNLDTYYLMDSILLKLPEMQDLLKEAQLMIRKALPEKNLVSEEKLNLLQLRSLIEFNAQGVQNGMQTAFNNNPAQNLRIRLRQDLDDFSTSTVHFTEGLNRLAFTINIKKLNPQKYDELAKSLNAAEHAFFDHVIFELDELLNARINRREKDRSNALMVSFLVMGLVIYLGWAFYVSVMRVVGLLGETSKRMAGGEILQAIELKTRDEMGDVVQSFNRVAEGLSLKAEKLLASEKLLSSILQALPVVVFCKDIGKNFKWSVWNKKAEEVFGFKAEDCLGKSDYDFFPPEQADWFRKKDIEASKTTETIDIPEELVSTKKGPVLLHTRKIVVRDSKGAPMLLLGVAEDITERKSAEAKLLATYQQLEGQKVALDQFAIVSEADARGRIIYVNDQFCRVSQYSREELLGQDHRVVNSGYHPKSFFKEMWATIESGKVWHGEVKNRTKDGSYYWVDTTIVPFLDSHGKPQKYFSVRAVITELKMAEEKLRQMADSVPGVVYQYSLDKNGVQKFIYMSAFAKILFGVAPQAIVDDFNLLWNLIMPEDVETVVQSIKVSAETLKPWTCEFRIKDAHGKIKYIQGDSTPEKPRGDGTITWSGVLSDITSRKLLEQQFLQSQKMEAVGSLAGGVAHDFNNLLTVINGYADLIATTLKPSDPMHSKIEQIQKAGSRAAGLTAQLLAFSRRQVIQTEIVDLNEQIVDMDQMLRRLITEQVELVTLQANDLWMIKIDPNQFQQIVMNLVVNARDAMSKGGKITLETQNKVLLEDYISDQVKIPAGKYVLLAVSDTGCGMSDEVRMHIFEPFFTTKEQGKGTGLGLATCYGIVKQADGYIYVHSVLNQGSTFKIYFPFAEEKANALPGGQAETPLPRGGETILLVEDESGLRTFAAELLKNLGYEVLEAENGEDALRVIKENPLKKIHLILTDVIMPRMGGTELVKHIQTLYPDMKILMMSGYTGSDMAGGLDSDIQFLQKPFSLKQLSLKIRTVLGETR